MENNNSVGVRKGTWTKEEDILLKQCIEKYGEGKWHQVPLRAGLNRCRKSCRLRWLNYLTPNIKRGSFTRDEVDLIVRLHKLLGNRWSLIAGRLPGRTGNDVKNFWNTHKFADTAVVGQQVPRSNIIKPQPQTFSKLHLSTLTTNCPKETEKTNHQELLRNVWTLKSNDRDNNKHQKQCTFDIATDQSTSGHELENQVNEHIRWWSELLDSTDNGDIPFPEEGETSSFGGQGCNICSDEVDNIWELVDLDINGEMNK